MEETTRLFISGSSPTRETAGCIVKTYESGSKEIELRAIGASSVNQAVKAMATARSILAQKGRDLYFRPGYDEVEIGDAKRTVMVFRLTIR